MTASVPLVSPSSAGDVPAMLRLGRTAGVVIALVVAAFLALSGSRADTGTAVASGTRDIAGLAVATDDLVNQLASADDVGRVTGGFVPGVGIVITAEIAELESSGIDAWTGSALRGQDAIAGQLDDGEDVIFLLDIAEPQRVSRLIAVSASAIESGRPATVREAPAISTAPLAPTFEPLPED